LRFVVALLFYVTHPQVRIDPATPVPEWGLNEVGIARMEALAGRPWVATLGLVVSSTERKALDAAEALARLSGAPMLVREGLHENDRSATGFLPPPEFEATADQFFARPQESVRGWERAVDAQARIVSGVQAVLREAPEGNVAFVGHGGVGTLLYCHLAGEPISRSRDQGPGGGNVFAFDRSRGVMLHGWRPLEEPRIGVP
jgi:broad specificity phosphatase PhoE